MNQPALSADDLAQDAKDDTTAPAPLTLAELQALGAELARLETEAAALETQLSLKMKQVMSLRNSKLPAALLALKLRDFTLEDGSKIELAEIIKGSITEGNRPAAHDWLRTHGNGDLIKNEVKTTFGMGEDAEAQKLLDLIKSSGIRCGSVEQKEAVHSSTLVAFLKDSLKRGVAIPADLFGLDVFHVVKFNKPKERKV